LIISRTYDLDVIKNVLFDSAIYDRISEDGTDDYELTLGNSIFVTDENQIGIMIYHWLNNVTLECHVQILPDYRAYAFEFGQSVLKWAWDNTKALKIVAQIPTIYPDVIGFSLKNGFEREGINKKSYLKNGVLCCQEYFGLCRPEV
jgi:RimJ/RimL family protein N-acetyltransferase